MTKTIIKVPSFVDDPLVGRCLAAFPKWLFHDKIIIHNNIFSYKCLKVSTKSKDKVFNLDNIYKFQLSKKELSAFSKEGKYDAYANVGTEISLYLIDKNEMRHELIPRFITTIGLRKWDKFINELHSVTGFPVEEIIE